MDRELVLLILVLLVCEPLLLAFGSLPTRLGEMQSGRRLEQASWTRIWAPLLPASIALSVLVGWALQEPRDSDETIRPFVILLVTPFAALWIRVIARRTRALLVAPPDVPAATVGLVRPRVVIGAQLGTLLDKCALRAAQEHEAAHARHRDPLRIWLAQLATDLQWPWPAAEVRLRSWLRALEIARDDEARGQGVDGADLAAAVVMAARLSQHRPGQIMAALTPDRGALVARVSRLLAPLPAPESGGRPTWLYRILVVVAVTLAVAFGAAYGEAAVRALPGVVG